MTPARPLTSFAGRLPVALLVALGLGISGCGGSEVEYQEVPGDPAEINLPDRTPAAPADGTDEEAAADETPTPEATETPAAEGAAGATTEEGAADQSAPAEETPAVTEDSAATDEPPAPGSDAERFEDFCEQNAGAC